MPNNFSYKEILLYKTYESEYFEVSLQEKETQQLYVIFLHLTKHVCILPNYCYCKRQKHNKRIITLHSMYAVYAFRY